MFDCNRVCVVLPLRQSVRRWTPLFRVQLLTSLNWPLSTSSRDYRKPSLLPPCHINTHTQVTHTHTVASSSQHLQKVHIMRLFQICLYGHKHTKCGTDGSMAVQTGAVAGHGLGSEGLTSSCSCMMSWSTRPQKKTSFGYDWTLTFNPWPLAP